MGNQEFQKKGNRLTSLSQEPATGNPAGVPLIALPQQPIVTDEIGTIGKKNMKQLSSVSAETSTAEAGEGKRPSARIHPEEIQHS